MGFERVERSANGRGLSLDGVSVSVVTVHGYQTVLFYLGPVAQAAVGEAPHGVHVLAGSGADAGLVRIVAAREGERGRNYAAYKKHYRARRVSVSAISLGLSGGTRPTVRPAWRALEGGGIEIEMPWGAEEGE